MARSLAHFFDHPRLRGVIVVARITEQQNRRLRVDVFAISLKEHLKRMAVVAMTVYPIS
jgi:hypothetical protein